VRTACVIVGAGPSGLEMSRALQERGVDHVVLEKDRIAETWRTQRWDSFRLNTPGYINGMLGNVAPNDFSTAAEVVSLLEQRAAEAPIREHSPAQSMHRDGDDYVLQTTDGEYRAGNVVVATGNQNVPRIPPMSNQLPDEIHQLHAAAYRNAGQLPPGAVLVVGSAQSGCQIAEDLVAASRRVHVSTSLVGRLPWRHRGRDTIQWLDEAGFWDQRPQDLEDPAMMRLAQPVVAPGGRDLSLQLLSRSGASVVGHLVAIEEAWQGSTTARRPTSLSPTASLNACARSSTA
jgi:putative flavoprotein involved in K+ transport